VVEIILSAVALGMAPPTQPEIVGHSTQGRPITIRRVGDSAARRRVLVVGCIHGNECEGIEITRRLVGHFVPRSVELWVVHNINPDGRHLGVRQNGRGVDLNRNFGSEWAPIGQRWDPEYSGPRPWSEPETRLARKLVKWLRPDASIWYHQPQALVRAWGHSRRLARRYAELAREPYRSIRWPNGTAPNWQNHRFRNAASFVVELPAGELPGASARRHAHAVRRLLALS
jgi:protein MpaA